MSVLRIRRRAGGPSGRDGRTVSALRVGAEPAASAAVLAGAAGVALHFSPFDARLPVLAAALVPYLLLGSVV
ncbi:hypothetical protein ACFUJ1_24585, partial [Nocardia sp. NPDC057227]